MLNFLNKNQGIITFLSLIITVILFIFDDKKIYAWLSLFSVIILLVIIYYFNKRSKKSLSFEEVRAKAKILFVDDKDCPVIVNLERNNFNVKKINDITNTQEQDVLWANLIFVDYKGVGISLVGKKEGLGLANLLEKDHGNKKGYIIYSSVQDFDEVIKYPYIRKNASYDEFVSLICSEISKL